MIEENSEKGSRRIVVSVVAFVLIGGALLGLLAAFYPSGGKPVPAPKTVSFGASSGPAQPSASGERIALTAEQVRNAGIVSEAVAEGFVDSEGTVNGTGVVRTNAFKDLKVESLVDGRVLRIDRVPGDRLMKGEVVAVIESEEFSRAQSEFLSARTAADGAKKSYARATRLLEVNQSGRSEYEAAVRASTAADAALVEMRSRFERSERLVEIGAVSRESFEAERTRLRAAEAEAKEAQARLARAKTLLEISPEARACVETALNEMTRAEGELATARQRLTALGMSDAEISALDSPTEITRELKLRVPFASTLISRSVVAGQAVSKNQEVFRAADMTELWFVAQVYERDLGRIKVGGRAEVLIGTDVEPTVGRVLYIDPEVNERTKSVQVRIAIPATDKRVLLGSYATLRVSTAGTNEKVVLVKASAVQRVGESDCVFVAGADGVSFELRRVRIGRESDGLVPVMEGLVKGEKVVVEGSFMLKAEYAKRKTD